MHFSVWPDPGRPTSEILDLAKLADELDWFGFWFADHYMPNTGSVELKPGDTHECWSILPAVAVATSNVRLGPLVAPTSIHHPSLLANRAATIDHLSNGRMVLGLGAGWQINEHAAYGIELEAPGARVSRFEEAIQITRSLLDNDHTTFDGEFYSFDNAPSDPKPIQKKMPIVVGTSGKRMCRITARHAQEWNTWGNPDTVRTKLAILHEACEAVGTDPASLHTSTQALFFLTDDEDKATSLRDAPMGERTIAGSDERIIDELGQIAEMGFDEVIVPDFTLGSTPEKRDEVYRHFAANIAPQIT